MESYLKGSIEVNICSMDHILCVLLQQMAKRSILQAEDK